tara:strand:+ start:204 stop:848 length:645 start_codon:yes stop_codon:yes gene_type:complete
MTEEVIFTPDKLLGEYETEEERIEVCKKLNEQIASREPYVPKVWTIEEISTEDYSRKDAAIIVAHLNGNTAYNSGITYEDNPHPALVRFFCQEYKGYYYDDDQNHTGCLYVTEDAFKLYDLDKGGFEAISEWMDEKDIAELNEDAVKPLTHMFIIAQYWAVYGPDCKLIEDDLWDTLPLDCQPYEDEFVLGINGLPQALIEDTDNCLVTGWCDG